MNRLGAGSKKLHVLSTWLVPAMPLVIALISWCNGLDGTEVWLKNRPNVFGVVGRIQEVSFWLYAIFWSTFAWAICYRRLGDPWLVEQLQFILDRYQAGAFNSEAYPSETPKDHNRVTLFRYQKGIFVRHWSATRWYWRWGNHWPLSNFLVPVLRSGHTSKKSDIAFCISDDSDSTEGVAGQAWACGQPLSLVNLPLMNTETRPRARALYAGKTYCNKAMIDRYIERNRPMPCSIVAIPVERHGKMWGVIVLDSRYPEGVTDIAVENYRLTVALVGRLLERAS